MAAEILFPHMFANLDITIPNLESFCQQYDIIRPEKNFILLEEEDEQVYFTEQSKNNKEIQIVDEKPYAPITRKVMDDEDLKSIKITQTGIQKFLDACIDGQMPFFEILKFYKQCERKNYLTVNPLQGDMWHIHPTISDAVKFAKIPLTDYIYIRGILLPTFGGKHDPIQFAWTKRCQSCGKYFQAKGPKTIFCSETCRSRVRFKAK